MHIYYYEEKFKYQGEDVISDYDEMPKKATDVRPKENLYVPEYDEETREWFESASKEYIDSLKPASFPPSDIELLKKQNANLLQQLAESEKKSRGTIKNNSRTCHVTD